MKKEKKTNIFKRISKAIVSGVDKVIITPISRFAYFIRDKFSLRSGLIDRLLNKPNVLLYISLFLAFVCFYAVDSKIISFSNTNAVVLSNQKVNVEYNEEAYVVEGLPTGADIILMGRKGDLFLAQQLGEGHEITLDLTDYGVGTHKVDLQYSSPINTLSYKLDPGSVTVVIYPKVSEVRSLSKDIINADRLDETLVVTDVVLDRDEVIVKSYQEKLDTVASVKAIVDVNALNANEAGTYTVDNVKLVAYDVDGKEIKDVEIVPGNVTATVTITSPSKTVPLTVVPVGDVRSGSAIAKIESSVSNVTIYADEEILANIEDIKVEIDVTNLSEDKVYQVVINKPTGARSINYTSAKITVTMESETSKDFSGVPIEIRGLNSSFVAQGVDAENALVTVTVKGVESLLKELETANITAYIDLSSITEAGTYTVPVYVEGTDLRLTYTSKTKNVQIIVSPSS